MTHSFQELIPIMNFNVAACLIDTECWWDGWTFFLVEGVVDHIAVSECDLAGGLVNVRHGVLAPVFFDWLHFLA